MTRTGVRMRTYASFDVLPFDGAEWDALVATSDTPSIFLTHGWQRAWWSTFGRGRLLLVVVSDGDGPGTIASLFVDEGMAFLVGSGGSDHLDVIGANGAEAVESVLRTLWRELPDLLGVRLYHVPDSSGTGQHLNDLCARIGLVCHDEGELPSPVLDLTLTGAVDEATGRKSLVRHEKWFRREGTLDIAHHRDPAAIRPYLESFFEQHVERWATTPYPSLFIDALQRAFYRRIVDEVGPTGRLRFTVVSWDGEPIAYHFGTCHRGTFLWYKPSFAIDLAQRSPGEVLLRSLLLEAAGEGATTFDFGLGDEAFKQRFASSTPLVRTWGIYPSEVR